DWVGRRAADLGGAIAGPPGVHPTGVDRIGQDPADRREAPEGLAGRRGDAHLVEVLDQPEQGVAVLQVPGEYLGDDGGLGRFLVDPRGVARPVGRDAIAVGRAGPREHLAGPELALAAAAGALGDQRALVLGDRPADLQ